MNSYNLFVNINYNNSKMGIRRNIKVNNIHINNNKYLIGSGIINRNGGNVIYTAKTMKEVRQVANRSVLFKDIPKSYRIAFIPKQV